MADSPETTFGQVNAILNHVQEKIDSVTDGIQAGRLFTAVSNLVSAMPGTIGALNLTDPAAYTAGTPAFTFTGGTLTHTPNIQTHSVEVSGASASKYTDIITMLDGVKTALEGIDLAAPAVPTVPTLDIKAITAVDKNTLRPTEVGALSHYNLGAYSAMQNPVRSPTPEAIDDVDTSGAIARLKAIASADLGDEPEFEGTRPGIDVFAWTDRTYTERFLPKVITAINDVLTDGIGLPAGVETALYDRARAREEQIAQRAIKDSFGVFAARGFGMPPGMQAAMTKKVIDENQLKLREFNQAVFIKRVEWELEQFKFAVQQGIAVEQMSFEVFKFGTQLAFEAAKQRLDMELKIFDAYVKLYEGAVAMYKARGEVYQARVSAAAKEIEALKVDADIEGLKVQNNRAEVDAYVAGFEAVKADAQAYITQLEIAKLYEERNKQLIDVHRAKVQMWEAYLGAEKTRVDSEIAVLQAQRMKGEIYNSELSAYNTYVQSLAQKAQSMSALAQGYVGAGDMETKWHEIDQFQNKLQLQYDIATEEAKAQAEMRGLKYVDFLSTQSSEQIRTQLATVEAQARVDVQRWEAEAKTIDRKNTQAVEAHRMKIEAYKMAAEAASRALQGALSTLHFSENLSGSASNGFSASRSVGYSYSGDVSSDVSPVTG